MTLHLERALFVVAPRNSGKSTALRSVFLDRRFGTKGVIPLTKKIPDNYYLSNERRLYLRLTSPHELGETPKEFIAKTKKKTVSGRWCFAGPFHPNAFKKMPDVVKSVKLFIHTFNPERVRIAFLSPTHHGQEVNTFSPGRDLTKELLAISRVEVLCLDGRHKDKNGLLLADFFDFT
jgi:hypothetical protein